MALPVLRQAVEDAARLGLLFGFVAEEGVLQGGGGIGRVEPHGLAKLVAGQFGLADLEVGVGQVLADVRRVAGGGEKGGDRDIVVAGAQGGVRAVAGSGDCATATAATARKRGRRILPYGW